jgi:hypothetical protein
MATQQSWTVWVDAQGVQSVRSLNGASSTAAIVSALEAYSNATVLTFAEGTVTAPATTPTAAAYPSVTAVAYLIFTDGAGHNARVALVAPQAAIFLSDGVSVDPTAIAPLIAACIGTLQTAAGTTVTAFVSGTLGAGGGNF